jgi:hypothetical protein
VPLRIGAIVGLSAPITDRAVTAARLLGDLTGETRRQPRVCGCGHAALMSQNFGASGVRSKQLPAEAVLAFGTTRAPATVTAKTLALLTAT